MTQLELSEASFVMVMRSVLMMTEEVSEARIDKGYVLSDIGFMLQQQGP